MGLGFKLVSNKLLRVIIIVILVAYFLLDKIILRCHGEIGLRHGKNNPT